MSKFYVDSGFPDHPKTVAANLSAIGLWTLAGAWSAKHSTDGFVPKAMIRKFGAQSRDADRLVEVGFWQPVTHAEHTARTESAQEAHGKRTESAQETHGKRTPNARRSTVDPDAVVGFQFHDWEHNQRMKVEVDRDKEANRKRQKAWRDRQRQQRETTEHNAVTNDAYISSINTYSSTSNEVELSLLSHESVTDTREQDPWGEQQGFDGMPEPSVPEQPPAQASKPHPKPSTNPEAFEEFWRVYPRRIGGKTKTRQAFDAAVKRASVAEVLEGARRFANDPNLPSADEARFIPYPTTWLNGDRWEDDPLPPRLSPQRTLPTDDRVPTTTQRVRAAQALKRPEWDHESADVFRTSFGAPQLPRKELGA